MVQLSNILGSWTMWACNVWMASLSSIERKFFSHYGAVGSTDVPFSGIDPGNSVYSLVFSVLAMYTVPAGHEALQWSEETVGDIIEGTLGYAWWLTHRPGVALGGAEEFAEMMYADWPEWRFQRMGMPTAVRGIQDVWRRQIPLQGVAIMLEEMVGLALRVMEARPTIFNDQYDLGEWAERFDLIRLGA